jgi:hypothetical protein
MRSGESRAAVELGAVPVAAQVCGLVLALGVGYFILHIPLQLNDNLANLVVVDTTTIWGLIRRELQSTAYLRPLLWVPIKLLYEVSGGQYFWVFRTFQVLQVVAIVALFVCLVAPRRPVDLAVVPFALTVLIGLHTFNGGVTEAFPVNHFLTVLICALGVTVLAFRDESSRWRDALAVLLAALALLTIESGALVWVCLVTAWLVGGRGLTKRAVIGATGILGLYLVVRFLLFDVGTPGLEERASGFGFETRNTDQLVALFGERPQWFYLYNVLSSIAGVLFSEPRAGVWVFTRQAMRGEHFEALLFIVALSLATTGLMIRFAVRRFGSWRIGRFGDADRLFLVFVAVLVVNGAISYPYTKDVVMGPAGVFYAAAAFIAVRDLLESLLARVGPSGLKVAAGILLAALAVGWSVRAVGLHYRLRCQAFVNRNEFAVWPGEWLQAERLDQPSQAEAILSRLRTDALKRSAPNPSFTPHWAEELFYAGF